jgi:hypothetical protein
MKQRPKTKSKQEVDKEHAEELLDRNLAVVRKIEYYQTSQWRRFKFWYLKQRKERTLVYRTFWAVTTGTIIGLFVGLMIWILRLSGVEL